jgi:hypothetical protein
MSTASGPKIANDGLVFSMDMDNVQKSWKGKPTTNLTTDAVSQEAGWSGQYALENSETKTFTFRTAKSTNLDSAWRGWLWDITAYIGQTVTISADVELVEESNASYLYIAIGQSHLNAFPTNLPSGIAADYTQYNTVPTVKTTMMWTGVINDSGDVGLSMWITDVTAAGGYVEVRLSNLQIEVSGFATPFINGVRSTTDALVDLTGSSTITPTSLTYASDNTFSFDGIDDQIVVDHAGSLDFGTGPFTIEFITYLTSYGFQGGSYINKGPSAGTPATGFGARDSHFYLYSAVGEIAKVGMVASTNIWQHHIFVIDQDTTPILSHYINGTLNQTNYIENPANKGSITNAWEVNIGKSMAGGIPRYFNGKMPMVRIYNKALTAAEVKQNFEAKRSRYGI